MRRCGVIGSPIAHSLSPQLHRAAYDWLGLDWAYDRHEVGAAEVGRFVAGLGPQWRGLSVTMPCKPTILALGVPDEVSRALGVANTLVFDGAPGDPATTRVCNTDVAGLRLVLDRAGAEWGGPTGRGSEAGDGSGRRAGAGGSAAVFGRGTLVLGNGATARSSVYALSLMGVDRVQVMARDQAKTRRLAEDGAGWGIAVEPVAPADFEGISAPDSKDFGGAPARDAPGETSVASRTSADLNLAPPGRAAAPAAGVRAVISTVPGETAVKWLGLVRPWLVFDVLYDPWPTSLAVWASGRGSMVRTGLDLLAAQAVGQVELMTGRSVPFELLREAADRAMADRLAA